MKLQLLREKLRIPRHLQNHFYFKIGRKVIKDEQDFVAWDVIERKREEASDDDQQDDEEEEKGETEEQDTDTTVIDMEDNKVVIRLYLRQYQL